MKRFLLALFVFLVSLAGVIYLRSQIYLPDLLLVVALLIPGSFLVVASLPLIAAMPIEAMGDNWHRIPLWRRLLLQLVVAAVPLSIALVVLVLFGTG